MPDDDRLADAILDAIDAGWTVTFAPAPAPLGLDTLATVGTVTLSGEVAGEEVVRAMD